MAQAATKKLHNPALDGCSGGKKLKNVYSAIRYCVTHSFKFQIPSNPSSSKLPAHGASLEVALKLLRSCSEARSRKGNRKLKPSFQKGEKKKSNQKASELLPQTRWMVNHFDCCYPKVTFWLVFSEQRNIGGGEKKKKKSSFHLALSLAVLETNHGTEKKRDEMK